LPDIIFPGAVEHVRVCTVLAEIIITAHDQEDPTLGIFKSFLTNIASTCLTYYPAVEILNEDGCGAFFSLVRQMVGITAEQPYNPITIDLPLETVEYFVTRAIDNKFIICFYKFVMLLITFIDNLA
jgi:hypothetical protein